MISGINHSLNFTLRETKGSELFSTHYHRLDIGEYHCIYVPFNPLNNFLKCIITVLKKQLTP